MFAPVGYSMFHEIYDAIYELVNGAIETDGSQTLNQLRMTTLEAMHYAIEEFSENCPSISVAAPDGRLMRVSGRILTDRLLFEEPHTLEELHFSFIDISSGLVKTQQAERNVSFAASKMKEATDAFQSIVQQDLERGQNHISQEQIAAGLYTWELQAAIADCDLTEVFSAFNGWSLVCKNDDIPIRANDITYLVELRKTNKNQINTGIADAYNCFVSSFPDGKGAATWAEVERVTGYSRRQINRGIRLLGGQKARAESGQDT